MLLCEARRGYLKPSCPSPPSLFSFQRKTATCQEKPPNDDDVGREVFHSVVLGWSVRFEGAWASGNIILTSNNQQSKKCGVILCWLVGVICWVLLCRLFVGISSVKKSGGVGRRRKVSAKRMGGMMCSLRCTTCEKMLPWVVSKRVGEFNE